MSKADRLEASGIQLFGDYYYIVFDNISAIAKLHSSLDGHYPDNQLISAAKHVEQFEGITYSPATRRFYVVVENTAIGNGETSRSTNDSSEPQIAGGFNPQIWEYDEQFTHLETHAVDYVFQSKNKGLEGLAIIQRDQREYVLGLCEAGESTGHGGSPPGHGIGTILVLQKTAGVWRVEEIIRLPSSVRFGDYASLDVQDNRIAVVSQVSSTLWVGQFQEDSWEFVDEGKVYLFPRDKSTQLKYCNVEGVTWIGPDRVAVVSDKRKSADSEGYKKKDQSIHVFRIPA